MQYTRSLLNDYLPFTFSSESEGVYQKCVKMLYNIYFMDHDPLWGSLAAVLLICRLVLFLSSYCSVVTVLQVAVSCSCIVFLTSETLYFATRCFWQCNITPECWDKKLFLVCFTFLKFSRVYIFNFYFKILFT